MKRKRLPKKKRKKILPKNNKLDKTKKSRQYIALSITIIILLVMIGLTIFLLNKYYRFFKPSGISNHLHAINKGTVEHAGPYMGIIKDPEDIKKWLNLEKDSKGVPVVYRKEAGKNIRHPVHIGASLLSAWGNGLQMSDPRWKEIRQVVEVMVNETQLENGIFPYPFPFVAGKYKYRFPVGWGSSMAQGRFLSVLARLYATQKDPEQNDPRLVDYAKRAMAPLERHMNEGGLMQLFCKPDTNECLVWYAEYPSNPPAYTLNGFIYTLIGIYDWARAGQDEKAAKLFWDGIATLEKVLPLYNNTPISTYDLSHYSWLPKIVPPNYHFKYHQRHILQLEWLSKATRDKKWECVGSVWKSYIDNSSLIRKNFRLECQRYFSDSYWKPFIPFDRKLTNNPNS